MYLKKIQELCSIRITRDKNVMLMTELFKSEYHITDSSNNYNGHIYYNSSIQKI